MKMGVWCLLLLERAMLEQTKQSSVSCNDIVFSAPCIQAMDWTDWVVSYSGACTVFIFYISLQMYIYKMGTCHVVVLLNFLFLPADIV